MKSGHLFPIRIPFWFLFCTVFTLTEINTQADESRLGILLFGGADLTNHSLTPITSIVTAPTTPTAYSSALGVGGHYRLNDDWAIEVDTFFSRSGFSNSRITTSGNVTVDTSSFWLYLPMLLKYFPFGSLLEVGVGPYFGYLLELTSVAALPATSLNGAQTTISDTNSLSTFSRLDVGPTASVEANIPIAIGINVIANCTFQYGLMNLVNSYDTLYSSYTRWILRGLIGLRLNWEIKSR